MNLRESIYFRLAVATAFAALLSFLFLGNSTLGFYSLLVIFALLIFSSEEILAYLANAPMRALYGGLIPSSSKSNTERIIWLLLHVVLITAVLIYGHGSK